MGALIHHLDKNQFIISTEPDLNSRGGNSAQHSMMFNMLGFFINPSNETFIQGAKRTMQTWVLMTATDGEPRLYWDSRYWPGQPGHMSRDNLFCSILALKLFKLRSHLFGIMLAIFFRAGFLWNTKRIGDDHWNIPDFCGPQMWMIAFRFRFNPLNIISDIYLFLSIYIQCENTARDKDHTDGHLNLIMAVETCRQISDNFVLKLIRKWYKNTNVPQYAVEDYFDNEFSAPLHQLIIPVIKAW